MNIRICKNILKYRKENNNTQAQIAEYLGVSPQAVSKWEQEAAMPDVYLIPKIAFFFNISIDTLFGTSNIDSAKLLVSKYSIVRNDKNYKDAKEAVDNLLEMNDEDIAALKLLCHLDYQRSIEYILYSKKTCEKLIEVSKDKDNKSLRQGKMQLMRMESMLGNFDFIDDYKDKFEETKSEEDFNYFLVALGQRRQFEESLRWGEDYIESFSDLEKGRIYPNLMEATLRLNKLEFGRTCFEKILEYNKEGPQIFNAWWLMWKLNKKNDLKEKIEVCRIELLKLLPSQGFNDDTHKYFLDLINGGDDTKPNIW